MKSPVSLFKSLQVTSQHILNNSRDSLTRQITAVARNRAHESKSNTWSASVHLEDLESKLEFKIKYGGHSGSAGLGFLRSTNLRLASVKERRKALGDLCKEEMTEDLKVKLHGLARSGDFLKWDDLESHHADWESQTRLSQS